MTRLTPSRRRRRQRRARLVRLTVVGAALVAVALVVSVATSPPVQSSSVAGPPPEPYDEVLAGARSELDLAVEELLETVPTRHGHVTGTLDRDDLAATAAAWDTYAGRLETLADRVTPDGPDPLVVASRGGPAAGALRDAAVAWRAGAGCVREVLRYGGAPGACGTGPGDPLPVTAEALLLLAPVTSFDHAEVTDRLLR